MHLWHADAPGTVVRIDGKGGIDDMARRLPAARVHCFAGAGHSIHNSARGEFMRALREVLAEAAPDAPSPTGGA